MLTSMIDTIIEGVRNFFVWFYSHIIGGSLNDLFSFEALIYLVIFIFAFCLTFRLLGK